MLTRPEPPLFQAHCERLTGLLPHLAHQLILGTLNALRTPSTDLALAQDRQLLFSVTESLQQHHARLAEALSHRLKEEVGLARRRHAPALLKAKPSAKPTLDELSLVDDADAQSMIEVARTVQLINMATEWSLRELQAFSGALLGDQDIDPEANPFTPAVFARALSDALAVLQLPEPARQLLLRVAGRVLAEQLHAFYVEACAHLRHEGIEPLAYKTVVNPHTPAVAAPTDLTRPGALDALLQRLPANSQLSAPLVSAALDRALQDMPHATASPLRADPQTIQALSQLLDRMVDETAALPGVQPLVKQLQAGMIRLALQDPQALSSEQHPSWQLINEVVSYASGFGPQDEVALRQFLDQVKPLMTDLANTPVPTNDDFERAREWVQAVIATQNADLLASRQAALQALEEADQREVLKALLQEQIEQQLEGRTVPIVASDFLRGPWVQVMAHVMTHPDMSEADSHALLNVVEDLVDSLQRPTTLDARDRLRQMLPSLTERLRKGMALIDWPPKLRGDLMEQLMVVHARYLRSPPAPAAELTPHQIVAQMRQERIDSVLPPAEAAPDSHLGALPTVPMGLDAPAPDASASAAEAWVNQLRPGTWCKLSLQGEWTTARLVWVSHHHRFFMFASAKASDMHTLPRRVLLRLRGAGLATALQDRSLMQRAADSLLQDLGN